MKEPRRGGSRPVSRRGLLGIFGEGLRELKQTAKAVEQPLPAPPAGPGAQASAAPPSHPRRARPAAEILEGVCDAQGLMTLDLRGRPLAEGASIRVDAVGFPLPLVLVRVNDVHYGACATTCPCDGSDVLWSAQADVLWCPSCGSRWTLDGRTARGPATRALRSFVVQEAEGVVRILPE